jgi:hypothetical protein
VLKIEFPEVSVNFAIPTEYMKVRHATVYHTRYPCSSSPCCHVYFVSPGHRTMRRSGSNACDRLGRHRSRHEPRATASEAPACPGHGRGSLHSKWLMRAAGGHVNGLASTGGADLLSS